MIRRFATRLGGAGLGANLGANGLSQAINVLAQLFMVPLLATHWGLETYGIWLVLFTIPYWLGVGDFGLLGAGANDMTAAVAQGRQADAARTFRALGAMLAIIAPVILLAALFLASGPLASWTERAADASGDAAFLTVMLMVAYGLAGQQIALAQGGMRASGAYAKGIYWITAVTILEVTALSVAVILGGTILHAAAIYCIGHTAGALGLRILLSRQAPFLRASGSAGIGTELRRLLRPALAMAIVPLCFALALQGPLVILGAFAGAAAVPAFSAVRTLSRAAVQVTALVSTSAAPLFTVADAQGSRAERSRLAMLSVATAIAILVPATLALSIFGPWFVALWTDGAITPDRQLVVLLAIAMLLHGLWLPLGNLIMAINRHELFTWTFLALALAALALVALLAPTMGANGAAWAALLLDLAMLGWISLQTRHLGLFEGPLMQNLRQIFSGRAH